MDNQKGYTLIELIIVLAISAMLITCITASAFDELHQAQATTRMAEARAVYLAGQTVLLEANAMSTEFSDAEAMLGLTGTIDDASYPASTRLSQRMTALLAPDVVLSSEPGDGTVRAAFVVKDRKIQSFVYQTVAYKKCVTITIEDGNTRITQERVE